MTDDLVFYTNPMSRGRIIRWMLEETGAPYRTEFLAYGPEMHAPAYLAINPLGKVPAITHRGATVTECAAICSYLADAFPEAGLAPAPGDRAASRPSPGTRTVSWPGRGADARISSKTRVAAVVNAAGSPKAAMSMAATNWPVLVGLAVSLVKSTTSDPKAAPFSTPAISPIAIANP